MDLPYKIINDFTLGKLSRRAFLKSFTLAVGTVTLGSTLSCFYRISGIPNILTRQEDLVLDAVQNHVFPRGKDSPSAREINALYYLHFVLLDPNMDVRENDVITDGVSLLEKTCQSNYKKSFYDLSDKNKEDILRKISDTEDGEYFLSYLLKYIFEALLADPNYGGNTNEVGWKWLDYSPGYPRPTKKQIYPKQLEI